MVINQKIEITDQCWNVFFPFSFVCLFYWRRGGLWWNWEYLQPKMASDILFRSQQGNEKFDPPWSRNCLFYWLYVKVSHAHWISQVRQRIFTKNGEKKKKSLNIFPHSAISVLSLRKCRRKWRLSYIRCRPFCFLQRHLLFSLIYSDLYLLYDFYIIFMI